MNHLWGLLYLTLSAGLLTIGDDAMASSVDGLPSHMVESNTPLSMKYGRRIEIHVQDPDLSKEECRVLIAAYRREAMPDGQVSVRKPSRKFNGSMEPWCVENMGGEGIFFNDSLF